MIKGLELSSTYRALPAGFMDGCALSQKSVIFGRNGSGKSTISELLRFHGEDKSKNNPQSSLLTEEDRTPPPIFVFNRWYVQENLQEFVDGSGTSAGIVQMGKQQIESATRVHDLRQMLEERKAWLERVEEFEVRTLRGKTQKDVAGDAKDKLIAEMAQFDDRKYDSTKFRNDVSFRERIATSISSALQSEEIDRLKSIAKKHALVENGEPPATLNGVAGTMTALSDQIAQVLAENIELRTLESLGNDRLVENWIKAGLDLHEPNQPCKFCGNDFSVKRFTDLAGHFRSELAEANSKACDRLLGEVKKLVGSVDAAQRYLASVRVEVEPFMGEFAEHKEKDLEVFDEFAAALDAWVWALEEKKARPIERPNFRRFEGKPGKSAVDSFTVINDYQEYSQGFQSQRRLAMEKLESHYLSQFAKEYISNGEIGNKVGRCKQAMHSSITRICAEVDHLESQGFDTSVSASSITEQLRSIYSRGELEVRTTLNGKGYVVLRNGVEARNLSEGERHVLALVYFINSLKGHHVSLRDSVVVIDDPVTSMDRENTLATYTWMMDALKRAKQVLVFTHDLHLFSLFARDWSQDDVQAQSSFWRMDRNWNSETEDFSCVMSEMPEHVVANPSEYHYLFWICASAIQGNLDAQVVPIIGNSGRRLLEGFLSFKCPGSTNLRANLETAWARSKQKRDLNPLRFRVIKFLNGESHFTDSTPDSRVWVYDNLQEIYHLMYMMFLLDREHFMGMMKFAGFPHARPDVQRLFRPLYLEIGKEAAEEAGA